MTSPAFWTQSISVVFYPPLFFHNSWALKSIASYEKNEQVWQAYERMNCRNRCIGRHTSKQHGSQVVSSQQYFLDSEQTFYTKHVLPV